MLSSKYSNAMMRFPKWLGLGVLVAALPLSMTAVPVVTAGFDFLLDGHAGSVTATYAAGITPLVDTTGTYLDGSDLDSFDVSWDGNSFTMGEALDYPTLPELLLPGNSLVPGGGYGFVGDWLVSGNLGSGTGTVLGLAANVPAYLLNDASAFSITSTNPLLIGTNQASINIGTITSPEPVLLPVLALGLAGLWFVRRRKAIQ
jgi:MYXO-CTERM domain-containing protein